MDILNKLREELQVERWQVEAAVKLIDEGNTIPFISRYRKEATGSLNDEVLRNLYERLNYLRNLEEKKTSVMASIEEQGKLTEDLKNKILAAETLVVVEDLYRPYRPKRKTRASVAKEKGLDGLADLIREQKFSGSLEEAAAAYVNPEKGAADTKEALQGAQDILAEGISDEAVTGCTSGKSRWTRASSPAPRGMKRRRVFMRCTISTRSRSKRQRDTVCWH